MEPQPASSTAGCAREEESEQPAKKRQAEDQGGDVGQPDTDLEIGQDVDAHEEHCGDADVCVRKYAHHGTPTLGPTTPDPSAPVVISRHRSAADFAVPGLAPTFLEGAVRPRQENEDDRDEAKNGDHGELSFAR